MSTRYLLVPSPIGEILLVSTERGLSGLYMQEAPRGPHAIDASWTRDPDAMAPVVRQLGEYFAGERRTFDLALDLVGTPFQLSVWNALREIPYGETRSYGALARRLGKPDAMRAVGLANGRNPVAVIVPCHRVIGANGSLVGFGGGIERKKILLALESPERSLF